MVNPYEEWWDVEWFCSSVFVECSAVDVPDSRRGMRWPERSCPPIDDDKCG